MPAAKPRPGTIQEVINLDALMGSSWSGFMLLPGDNENHYQGRFQHAYWRKPFEHGDLCAMFYTSQEVHMLRHTIERMRKEIETAQLRAEQAEAHAQFYRHQLHAESRYGLMFIAPKP